MGAKKRRAARTTILILLIAVVLVAAGSPNGKRQLSIRYHRLDKPAFDETHARIASSLRFE